MSKKISWGIIGLGKIAKKFSSDLLLAENAALTAVASRDIGKAKAFAEEFQASKAYGSYEELANDHDIDIVYIATPHVLHFENTMMCLRAGKSVLCEKPFAMNTQQVEIMTQEASKRGLFLMEALWTRFIPCTEQLIELLQKGTIGEVQSVHADFGFRAPKTSRRLFEHALGGGALLDVGIYPVYLALLTLGVPTSFEAMARMTEEQIDTFCGMLFDYQNGAKAVLDCSIESQTPTEAYIHGTNGTIKLHSRFHHPEKISISVDGKEDQVIEAPYTGFGYYHEILSVQESLSRGQTENEKMPHSMSLKLIQTLDAIREKIGLQYEQDTTDYSSY